MDEARKIVIIGGGHTKQDSDKLKADLEDVFGDADKTIEFFNEGGY